MWREISLCRDQYWFGVTEIAFVVTKTIDSKKNFMIGSKWIIYQAK